MTHQAYTALQASIAHWKRLAEGERLPNEFIGADNCALCVEFVEDGCNGCPVSKKKNAPCCSSTPYEQIAGFISSNHPLTARSPALYEHPEFLRLAKLELSFLISLLPLEEEVEEEEFADLGF